MITFSNIAGQKYAVLGLGKSGITTAASLRASNADVVVWDDSEKTRAEAEKAGYKLVDLTQADLTGFKALILAPGIPLTHSPHPVVTRCRAAKIPIIGDIELLFRACPDATYVGITGTNGKSTTTALIAHILQKAGKNIQVGGNLGTPVLSFEPLGGDGIYVLELSSYQLELIEQNPIKVAVFLNITPDHLDRHGDMVSYIAAKKNIVSKTQPQTLVIGSDEPEMRAVIAQARELKNLQIEEISVEHAVAHGVMAAGQQMFAYHGEEQGGMVGNLTMFKTLPGKHNAQNACAAFAACTALGLSKKEIVEGLRTFPGLAHRQQLIAEIKGVRFINDSKATNADAASKALACYTNIYWIIGGKPKEGGLSGLESFTPRIRHAFLIGQASEDFAAWCKKNNISHTLCGTLDVATERAAALAWAEKKADAVVLLSPACASWDQFNNFEERGEKFAECVQGLNK